MLHDSGASGTGTAPARLLVLQQQTLLTVAVVTRGSSYRITWICFPAHQGIWLSQSEVPCPLAQRLSCSQQSPIPAHQRLHLCLPSVQHGDPSKMWLQCPHGASTFWGCDPSPQPWPTVTTQGSVQAVPSPWAVADRLGRSSSFSTKRRWDMAQQSLCPQGQRESPKTWPEAGKKRKKERKERCPPPEEGSACCLVNEDD